MSLYGYEYDVSMDPLIMPVQPTRILAHDDMITNLIIVHAHT